MEKLKILLVATEERRKLWQVKLNADKVDWSFASTLPASSDANLVIDDIGYTTPFQAKPNQYILVNAVINQPAFAHPQYFRYNGWPTFFEQPKLEITGSVAAHLKEVRDLLNALGCPSILTSNVNGLMSTRVVAMIINEAFFALEAGVSSKEDIDTAMKLGTNYPYGPFEWAAKIGIEKIYELLKAMSKENPKYQPCKLMAETVWGLCVRAGFKTQKVNNR